MKILRVFLLSLTLLYITIPFKAFAQNPPKLVLSQYKVTSSDGQFFMIYNSSAQPIDMSSVHLIYYNHYNLTSATSSKTIPLSGVLQPSEYYLINDGPLTLCYKMLINSTSLGFSSTNGHVQIAMLSQANPGAPVISNIEDSTSWSKTAISGVTTLPPPGQFLYRNPIDINNNPTITLAGSGSWIAVAINPANPCMLSSTNIIVPPPVISTSLLLLSSTPPPVTILSITPASTGPYLPASDIGLMAPIINELLPNPGKPLTDANDEFVEIYNPNDKPFDLTGFSLEVGLTTKYKWKFPDGTILAGKSFTAFSSAQTTLSLNNSSGIAHLLDPFGNIISISEEYGIAKDNQAWALANNEWHYTVKPTPGEANVISANIGSSGTKSSGKNASSAVKGFSSTGNVPNNMTEQPPEVAELHPSALASVGVLALGYGAYEYKQDISNRIRRFRANRALGRKNS